MPALYIPSLSYEPEDSDEHVIASLADRRRENIFLFFYITNERVQLTPNTESDCFLNSSLIPCPRAAFWEDFLGFPRTSQDLLGRP